MGAIAEAFAEYAQPLFDQTDGSLEKMERAMLLAQMCYNLALLPEDQREKAIDDMRPGLNMTEDEFAEFRQGIILPMIRRHFAMFPGLHTPSKPPFSMLDDESPPPKNHPSTKKRATVDRYALVPAGAGGSTSSAAARGNECLATLDTRAVRGTA